MSEFSMPAALELEAARRSGIPAFRREVVHNTTTQNEYRPGELCYIPIDTGAAGAFMDVTTTRLEFVVSVLNKNYYTDFINLPRCGWNAVIQEFGIELNNGLHELNRHYAECIELHMIKKGENRTPFEMTRTNPWKAAEGTAGKMHINFIKPSMVTLTGLPHNTKYSPLGTTTSSTTPDFLSQSYLYYSQPFTHESFGRKGITNTQGAAGAYAFNFFHNEMASSSMEITQSVYEDQINTAGNYVTRNKVAVNAANATAVVPSNNGTFGFSSALVLGETSDTKVDSVFRCAGQPQGSLLRAMARSNVDVDDLSMYSLVFGQSGKGKSAGMWPAYQPCPLRTLEKEYQDTIRFVNADNVFSYYANVKNIPVGIPIDLDGDSNAQNTIWGDSSHTKATIGQYGAQTEFHVSVKIYSSLIGELADRWFPELIVPQGRMRVRLRFQDPNIVFQTLMDPCRRVPGTSRDFIPYSGLVKTEAGGVAIGQGEIDETISLGCLASGIHPIMISDFRQGSVFVDAIALGKYPLPHLRLRALHTPFGGTPAAWQSGAAPNTILGNEYLYSSIQPPWIKMDGGNPADGFYTNIGSVQRSLGQVAVAAGPTDKALVAAPYTTYAQLARYAHELVQNQEYGCPANSDARNTTVGGEPKPLTYIRGYENSANRSYNQKPQTIADLHYYSYPTDWQNHFVNINSDQNSSIWIKPDTVNNGDVPPFKTLAGANSDEIFHCQNWNPFGIPVPQYVPMRNPFDKRSERQITAADYVSEDKVCYGTFLEASVAQVRRSHGALYPLNITDLNTSGVYERLTYTVKNIQIVTQQIVLPRGTALSIVENALDGGITMECRAWKEMESIMPNAESQKHLINMAAAFCTDISFIFRPVQIYQGDIAYGYNSFSFYNPFTAFDFSLESNVTELQVNALGGTPVYYNECVMSTRVPFDIQLQIATELLPRTPIDSINALLRNGRWGGQVFSDRDYMELNPHLVPSYQTSKGMAINTLQDGFWACYTPIHCLEDQTITDNPFFVPLEFSLGTKIRGSRSKGGSLPIFKPYDGTFHLSFNLEAYMGQSDRLRTGIPIVNNNMFLKMERAHLCRVESTQLLTIVSCDAKVVFERGGTVQFFT